MEAWAAGRIRSGFASYSVVRLYLGLSAYGEVRRVHRGRLVSSLERRAFDRAEVRAVAVFEAALADELRISVEFVRIINRNFQEAP